MRKEGPHPDRQRRDRSRTHLMPRERGSRTILKRTRSLSDQWDLAFGGCHRGGARLPLSPAAGNVGVQGATTRPPVLRSPSYHGMFANLRAACAVDLAYCILSVV
eukprot:scaffold517_cov392-Prasinococcus_capsulatus_cf.AAC.14